MPANQATKETIGAGSEGWPNRVLMVITTLTFGGAETQVVRLAKELKERGWEVGIACLLKPTNFVAQLEKNGIDVFSLAMARGVPDVRAIFRLRRLIKTFKPSVVHSHMVHANLLARITRLFCRMPALICTAHNLRETSEKGGPTWHKELLYRLTDFLADRTTIICQAAFDRYVKVGAVPAEKFEVIHNGVDIHRFAASSSTRQAARYSMGFEESTFVWLAVGRLVEQKDYATLLRATQLLPHTDWVLLVAGNGPLLEPLRAQARKLGVEKKVRFLGAHESILNLYSAADAFVMSSVFEGLPAALLEAASMSLPSVVTDAGGNTEIALAGETGYVVPIGDPEQLGQAMRRLMSASPGERQLLGANARRHCVNGFRFELVTAKWIELYAGALAGRAGRRQAGMVMGPVAHP